MSDVIVVQNLGKRFRRYHADRPRTLKEALLRGLRRMGPIEEFWALREVNFRVAQGDMVGIIGRNGAGKSTLLRLIGGVGRPDEGSIEVQGRTGAFLDLVAGFRPDLTGSENVFIGGVIAGLTRHEVSKRFDSIVAFAELEDFIDNPLRAYSTGMRMRLAFAVAVHTDPEVLLIDEVLAVGDLAFRNKCFERIGQFKREGCTILLVSHDVDQIRDLCDEALWLRDGRLVSQGDPEMVVGKYAAQMRTETTRRTPTERPVVRSSTNAELRLGENRLGSLELEIVDVRFLDPEGFAVGELSSGAPLSIEIDFLAPEPIPSPIFSVGIAREDRQVICTTNTRAQSLLLPTVQGRGRVALHFRRLDLVGGHYFVSVGAYEQGWAYAYDYHDQVYPLTIRATRQEKGILYAPHSWGLEDVPAVQADPSEEKMV